MQNVNILTQQHHSWYDRSSLTTYLKMTETSFCLKTQTNFLT